MDPVRKVFRILVLQYKYYLLSMVNCHMPLILSVSSRLPQRGSGDSHSSEELPVRGAYEGLRPPSSGSEEAVQALPQSPAPCTGT